MQLFLSLVFPCFSWTVLSVLYWNKFWNLGSSLGTLLLDRINFYYLFYALRLGKKHDQDELHPADHLHCSDCFLWLWWVEERDLVV